MVADISQQAAEAAAHGDFPVRQAQETPVQVYLRPCEIQNFSGLHLKLPAHPEGQSHHGAALLLNDPPKEVFAVRRQLRRGALALLKVLGKGAPEGGDRHAADPGGVGPVMSLKLADDEVLTEILETDLLALGVQRGPGQPGDGLRRHGPLISVGNDDMGVPLGVQAMALPEAVLRGGGQRDGPIRKGQGIVLKLHLIPGEGGDLLPAQALQPRQTENGPFRAVREPSQYPLHSRRVRPFECISHSGTSPSPPGVPAGKNQGRWGVYKITLL